MTKFECIKEFIIYSGELNEEYQVHIGEMWEEDKGIYFDYDPHESRKNLITDRDGQIIYFIADPESIKEHFKIVTKNTAAVLSEMLEPFEDDKLNETTFIAVKKFDICDEDEGIECTI
ncbi:MAG: hypothetical protein LBU81_00775 [Methanosarcinales archaeon]|jgi:hypothetical protein|nr:hypothetical protein [Methanosarcinales archaeon]